MHRGGYIERTQKILSGPQSEKISNVNILHEEECANKYVFSSYNTKVLIRKYFVKFDRIQLPFPASTGLQRFIEQYMRCN